MAGMMVRIDAFVLCTTLRRRMREACTMQRLALIFLTLRGKTRSNEQAYYVIVPGPAANRPAQPTPSSMTVSLSPISFAGPSPHAWHSTRLGADASRRGICLIHRIYRAYQIQASMERSLMWL